MKITKTDDFTSVYHSDNTLRVFVSKAYYKMKEYLFFHNEDEVFETFEVQSSGKHNEFNLIRIDDDDLDDLFLETL